MSNLRHTAKDKEITEKTSKTRELLSKMHTAIDEEKFAHLADEVSELAFDMLEVGKRMVRDVKKKQEITEDDEYKLARVNRMIESCSKALDSVNNFKNKRFMEINEAVKTEVAIENANKEPVSTNIIFQWQGDGKPSISPVTQLWSGTITEEKQLPPPKPAAKEVVAEVVENPLDTSGNSHKKHKGAAKGKKKLCCVWRLLNVQT